jgi:hypothetical protein
VSGAPAGDDALAAAPAALDDSATLLYGGDQAR